MSSNKSPANNSRPDGSKQGNEQNSEKQGATQVDQANKQQSGQTGEPADTGKADGKQRSGSKSGGGKS